MGRGRAACPAAAHACHNEPPAGRLGRDRRRRRARSRAGRRRTGGADRHRLHALPGGGDERAPPPCTEATWRNRTDACVQRPTRARDPQRLHARARGAGALCLPPRSPPDLSPACRGSCSRRSGGDQPLGRAGLCARPGATGGPACRALEPRGCLASGQIGEAVDLVLAGPRANGRPDQSCGRDAAHDDALRGQPSDVPVGVFGLPGDQG